MSPGKIVALIFAGIFGLSLLIVFLSALVNPQRDTKSVAKQSNSISATSSPTVNKSSPDYQSGFKKGMQMGKDIAKTPGGMPLPVGIRGMANIQIQEANAVDENAWRSGFEDGFRKGFESIRGASTRKDKDYEQLSWSNAKPNVKLYGYDEKHEATIVSVNGRVSEFMLR